MSAVLLKQLTGQVVSRIVQADVDRIAIHFESGLTLLVRMQGGGVVVVLDRPTEQASGKGPRPTARQREYLEFITRYMARFGRAPAESDIERHFLVSAPSVNQMVRTLERRGFITRERDWNGLVIPRSIRVVNGES